MHQFPIDWTVHFDSVLQIFVLIFHYIVVKPQLLILDILKWSPKQSRMYREKPNAITTNYKIKNVKNRKNITPPGAPGKRRGCVGFQGSLVQPMCGVSSKITALGVGDRDTFGCSLRRAWGAAVKVVGAPVSTDKFPLRKLGWGVIRSAHETPLIM